MYKTGYCTSKHRESKNVNNMSSYNYDHMIDSERQ